MQEKIVKVYAPATIANIGAGFDVLGVALESPGDFVTAKRNSTHEFHFSVESKLSNVPVSVADNVAAVVALEMLKAIKPTFGIDMVLHKMMPLGSGLGSSGASCVAAAVAVNMLLDHPLEKKALLPFVMEGERKASGAAHADNVAPSLLGGACIVRNEDPLDVIAFTIHPDITWVVIHPHISVNTADARRVLPKELPLAQVTRQLGNIGGLILGLIQGQADMIRHCMVDHIAEPVRQGLIPGFAAVKAAAIAAGALGCGISGSGPSLFAITLSVEKAKEVAEKMAATFMQAASLKTDIYISRTNITGAKIV